MDKPSLPSFLRRRCSPDISGFIRDCRDLQVHAGLTGTPPDWEGTDPGDNRPWHFPTDPSLSGLHLLWDPADQQWKPLINVSIPRLQWTFERGAGAVVYATSKHPPVGVTAGQAPPDYGGPATPAAASDVRACDVPVDVHEVCRRLWQYDPEPEPWEVPSDPSLFLQSHYDFIPRLQWLWYLGYDGQPYLSTVCPPEGVTAGGPDPSGLGQNSPATDYSLEDHDEPVDARILSELLWRDKRPAPEDWDPDDPDGEP